MASRLTKAGGVGLAAAGVLAVGLIGGFEGKTNKAIIPIPGDRPTICYGETRGVKMGDYKTDAECDKIFAVALADFETGMRRCLKSPDTIPDRPYVTFLSLSYNIGVGGFCNSSVARAANAGDLKSACQNLAKFNRAGGQVIKGLVNRREKERKECLAGLKEKPVVVAGVRPAVAAAAKEIIVEAPSPVLPMPRPAPVAVDPYKAPLLGWPFWTLFGLFGAVVSFGAYRYMQERR